MANQNEILTDLGCTLPAGAQLSGSGIDGSTLGNDPTLEGLWAIKAMEHAEVHFNILCVVDPSVLKLTQKDQLLYEEFRRYFPDFNVEKIDERSLKSKEAKEKWRPFMNALQDEVVDFSLATLVRMDTSDDYSQSNSIIVTRVQFLCIEIARNREGHNNSVRVNFKPKPHTNKAT
uniref:Protein PBDC1-like n=1 Tax=Hirondellea gigas TaxID=1518452 RepID=A0A2P2I470_9CRUS